MYAFSGSAIPKNATSVFVSKIENKANLTSPDFSQELTNSFIDRFLNETKLSIKENSSADLIFIGEVTNYSIKPISISSNESATQNRLSITVKIKYENKINSLDNYEKELTN